MWMWMQTKFSRSKSINQTCENRLLLHERKYVLHIVCQHPPKIIHENPSAVKLLC